MERHRTLQQKRCCMCSFESSSIALLLSHFRLVHSSDPRFSVCCGINSCTVTCKSFSSLYSHVYRHHRDAGIRKRNTPNDSIQVSTSEPTRLQEDNIMLDSTVSADVDYMLGYDKEVRKRSSALLILKLKEQRRVSQVAIDDIIENSEAQFERTTSMLLAHVRSHLAEKGIDSETLGLDSTFLPFDDSFAELDTKYKQDKYFKDTLGLVEPEEIKIGDAMYCRQFTGSKSRFVLRHDTYHYVPIFSTLRKLLSDSTIAEEIERFPSRIRDGGLIEDFCDGSAYKNHPIFSKDPYALQIIAYFDELEVCNPLGSHVKKHKVGVVFFTLGNIHPKCRSTFKAINLALLATKPVIERHGIDAILKPFFRDLSALATTGISLNFQGRNQTFKGALLAFLADNLASNELGGFKLSFSFSFRCCRTCLVTTTDMSGDFNSDNLIIRDTSTHENQCALLTGPAKSHYSKTYGINRRSALLDVAHFPFFSGGLPHDWMHDILEGIAPLEIKLLLKHCISEKFFLLTEYNQALVHFNYGYTETDKPIPIVHRHFLSDKPLRSSASQMLLLIQILPFLIGNKLPESDLNWKCFLLLRKVIDIVLCPIVNESMASSLKLIIVEHNALFKSLYPSSFIPKLHFLIHYPEQMLQVGPMIRTWTIRHEAKLNFFKQAASLSSFKNVTLSLANHHQRLACYEMANGNLLRPLFECGPVNAVSSLKNESLHVKQSIMDMFPGISEETQVSHPNWVKKDGVTYKTNNAYVVVKYDGLDPIFAYIDDLVIIAGDKLLYNVRMCTTQYFDDHFHAYVIDVTSRKLIIQTIVDRNVLCMHIFWQMDVGI